MSKAVILVLDYGTTALKAAAYDESFRCLGTSAREWTYIYPAPGCIEYPAEEYWNQTLSAFAELREKVGGFDGVRVMSVTGQSETMIPLDADGKPIGNAIVWLDSRPVEECEEAKKLFDPAVLYAQTGNCEFNLNMPLLKMMWMKNHEPERYARMAKMTLLKDFIVYKLSGRIITEHTVNCCSGYFDIVKRDWSDDLLKMAGISRDVLPELAGPRTVVGNVCARAAEEIGVPAEAQVVNGLLDQVASAIGAGNLESGIISETTGTVLAIAATLDKFEPERMSPVLMFCHAPENKFLALPNCPTAGVLLTWFRNTFLSKDEMDRGGFNLINEEVEKRIDKETDLILLPHFSGRLSPVVNGSAKGVLYGLTLDCDKFDIARSVMESVSYLLRENLELLDSIGVTGKEVISLGGATKSAIWEQIKADVCGRDMVLLEDGESTALGCALDAAVATGMLKEEDIPSIVRRRTVYHTNPDRVALYNDKYAAYQSLNNRLGYDETV